MKEPSTTSKLGANLENVQEINRSLVMRLLRQKPVWSRAEIAKLTGLKQSTITNIVNDFIQWGFVYETGIIEGEKGRRSIGIALNGKLLKVIGVRLARNSISAGLFDLDGHEYAYKKTGFDITSDPKRALSIMRDMIRDLLQAAGNGAVYGIGVAAPGPLVRHGDRVALMTDFLGWEPMYLQEELQAEFGLPVCLEHDADAGALAEWWLGAERSLHGTMLYVLISEGLGASLLVDGTIYRGHLGMAGEIGHMSLSIDGPVCECGHQGCFEKYCSVLALKQEVHKRLEQHPHSSLTEESSYIDILEAFRKGDAAARQAFEQIAWYLGFGLTSLIHILNPQRIVIADDLSAAGEPFLNMVKKVISERILPSVYEQLSVELTKFQSDPILLGASAVIIDDILRKPTSFIFSGRNEA